MDRDGWPPSRTPVGWRCGGGVATETQKLLVQDYARRVRDARRAHASVTELGLAPEFYRLLGALLPTLEAAPALTLIAEYTNPGIGRPDIALTRTGQPARAYVELKSIEKSADGSRWRDAHDKRQFQRFSEFALWATSNFHELRLYERKDEVAAAVLLPKAALDPERTDARADKLIDEHDIGPALRLIERLAQAPPPVARDAKHLAELLAYSARLVRGIVADRLAELNEDGADNTPLQQVREEFRKVLYSKPEAAGMAAMAFDDLFSSAFAQTLAFGLLLVREATGETVDRHAYEHMPDEHPLMKTTLRVLSQKEVADEIGAGFDVMLDTVNCLKPLMLALRADGYDPILYFYENFLEKFDPDAREKFGVYYTPIEVVRYMVGALDRALRENLGVRGLGDESVHILDPATGTGTFLLGVAERVRRDAIAKHGPGQAELALRGLIRRMYGFELLVGPYAVSHYRLHHSFARAAGGALKVELPRLGVYLTDTLAEPNAAAPLGQLGFVSAAINDERALSNKIKTEQPILAIIGNPPYRRLETGENETLVGRWLDALWDDLKAPVRDAGWGNQLNTFPEMSVAFWRWSIWKLFEAPNAPRRGVVALITNRKFLTGKPYAGLRKMLRERFDKIEIIDLRGDVRLGERAGVEDDQGVFNIQVGTAITLAIADGSKAESALAAVRYNDIWGHKLTARRDKLKWLEAGAEAGRRDGGVSVMRAGLDDMRPMPFLNGDLIGLSEGFEFKRSGIQTKRDEFIYATSKAELSSRIVRFIASSDYDAKEAFHDSRDRKWAPARNAEFSDAKIQCASYRPLDTRWFYNHEKYGDFLRPELQAVWGASNVGLYAMPNGTGEGPAVWCHGLLPDYHAFRGSYGGYAFPLYDRRQGQGPYNLKPELVAALTDVYGVAVTPEQAFDAILCLLSAKSYTSRFAEDLEDVFPHMPFPAAPDVFLEAAKLGAEIREVETFARAPREEILKAIARAETSPSGKLAPIETLVENSITLCADGSGRVSNIPQAVWDFAVSGYRLLPRWLAARAGLVIDENFIPELRDVAARIAELLVHFEAADTILERTLADSLTRETLGVGAVENATGDDESD
jgi:Type ISP C-terminal specificity domain/N-6 DNA Methylase